MRSGFEKEELVLLQQSHSILTEYAGPEYEALRALLDNRLGGVALEGVAENERARDRRGFLANTVAVLPQIHGRNRMYSRNVFSVDNEADFRRLQASVLWVQRRPYYIIGESTQDNVTEVLLHDVIRDNAIGEHDSLIVGRMRTREYQKMIQATKDLFDQPLSPDETNRHFDTERDALTIGRFSPGNMNVQLTSSTNFVIQKLELFSLVPGIKITRDLSQAIYPMDFVKYNVPQHLSHLAHSFGVSAALDEVYASYRQPEYEQLRLC